MHQTRYPSERRRDRSGDEVVGDVQHREPLKSPDTSRDRTGELVADQIQDTEEGQGGNAGRNLAGDSLPISDNDAREAPEFTDGWGDSAVHVASAASPLEYGVLRLATEVDVGDAVSLRVATHAVPLLATVVAPPGVENTKERLVEG